MRAGWLVGWSVGKEGSFIGATRIVFVFERRDRGGGGGAGRDGRMMHIELGHRPRRLIATIMAIIICIAAMLFQYVPRVSNLMRVSGATNHDTNRVCKAHDGILSS